MLMLLSVLLKLAGVIFLCIAALGVIRLPDPFQRMHAATKAGTLGAGLVLLGSILSHGEMDAVVLGLLTLLFLLLTVPVAGHLLGRAAYVSGARMSLAGGDALEGVLRRAPHPLDERMSWDTSGSRTNDAAASGLRKRPQEQAAGSSHLALQPLTAIRFAIIGGAVPPVAARAGLISQQSKASLTAYALIDTQAIEVASDPARMRREIRDRASEAIRELKDVMQTAGRDMRLVYDEGDPEQLLQCTDTPGRTLLVLPCSGWFHHRAEGQRALTTWDPDGLLRLPSSHRGPVLFASGTEQMETEGALVVRDCGEPHLPALTSWALSSRLWKVTRLVHVTHANSTQERQAELEHAAWRAGCSYEHRVSGTEGCAIPSGIEDVRAVILGRTPRPLRTTWYGVHWRERIMPGMTGDVLIMEPDHDGR
jgi:monovalent cation/proton antiporter MnhG/PhaG subunit